MASLASYSVRLSLARFTLPILHHRLPIADSVLFRVPSSTATRFQTARDRVLSFRSIADEEASDVKPRSVPVHVAYELLQGGHRYLDVRTRDEFSAGHPSGSVNIPFMFSNGTEMSKNPKFLDEVSSHFGKDDEIVVGCKTGRRSLMAASDLQSAGYTRVADVAGGYCAWTEHGLPVHK